MRCNARDKLMTIQARQIDLPATAPSEPYRDGALLSLLKLHWFIRMRWIILLCVFTVLAAERVFIPEQRRPAGLAATLVGLALLNLVWMLVSHRLSKVQTRDPVAAARGYRIFANAQVACDLFFLTLVLRYTGGIESPMAVFYVFHMAIGSLLLRAANAVLQAGWAVVLYASMGVGELLGWFTPHYALLPVLPATGLYSQAGYVAAAVVALSCGVFGTLYFSLRIVAALDARERRLRAAHEALQQSQAAVQDLQARKSRFMQTAAHQLKSPLAIIQTLAGLIHDRIVTGDAVVATSEKITRRCQDGISAVTELLTLARAQEATPERHTGATAHADQIVRKVFHRYELIAHAKGLATSCTVQPGSSLSVRVHPGDLADCVVNLLDNAVKYTPEGGAVRVRVERSQLASFQSNPSGNGQADAAATEGDWVSISVEDTGAGIDPAELVDPTTPENGVSTGSIFDAFRRGNNALQAGIPGSGLGLSIVRAIVEQAGGRLEVRSTPGQGSQFTLRFPSSTSNAMLGVRDTRASQIVIHRPQQRLSDTNVSSAAARTQEIDHA